MKMDELAENILKKVLDKSLTEDMVYELTRACVDSIVEEMAISWTDALRNLESFLDSLWRSKGYRQYDADDVFELGRVYTAVDMLKMVSEKHELTVKVREDAGKYAARRKLFEQIAKNPGITHKDLARKVNISESALSQFYGKIQYDNYILSHKAGRTKYYYLSMTGKQLLAEMERNMHVDLNTDLDEMQCLQRDDMDRLSASTPKYNADVVANMYGCYKMREEEEEDLVSMQVAGKLKPEGTVHCGIMDSVSIQIVGKFGFNADSVELSELLSKKYIKELEDGKLQMRKGERVWKTSKRLKQA